MARTTAAKLQGMRAKIGCAQVAGKSEEIASSVMDDMMSAGGT
jgi:hypothetical protein